MFIGLDIGTSAVKTVAVRNDRIVAEASTPLTVQSPQSGWSEQDPSAWWNGSVEAIKTLLADGAVDPKQIKGIGLSGQMHGAVVLGKDKVPLRPCILWNDSRSTEQCDQLEATYPQIGEVAGVLPLPGFTAPKIMWLADHAPDIYAKIAHILLPKDYVGYCLHGNMATDVSDAAGSLWLDQACGQWSTDLCDASQTDINWLPELHHGSDICGHLTPMAAETLGLPSGLPIVAGGGDAATGAISLGVVQGGAGFLSLGTSGQLFVAGDQYAPNPAHYVHAFAHTVPDRWYQMAALLNGARPLSWLAGILKCSVADVVAQASQADPERVPIFLPYLTGERSPHGDPFIRGGFYGLEDSTDTAAMCLAVMEAVSFCFADAAASFGQSIKAVETFQAIGGGAQSALLLQLIANAIDTPIQQAGSSAGGPAYGAARLAAIGVGDMQTADLTQDLASGVHFDPKAAPHQAERLTQFRQFYRTLAASPLHRTS